MSVTKTKEELIRLSWLMELRRQGHRQNNWRRGTGDHCALSLLWEMLGKPDQDLVSVAFQAGLSAAQANEVMRINDGRVAFWLGDRRAGRQHTFSEIADVVAAWFPK